MKILGIEWSSSQRTLALGEWSANLGVRVHAMAQLPEGRDSRYFETFQRLSKQTDTLKSEIKAVVVGIGPGSYAGIRSAISVAYGWHLANDAKLIGISSAKVVARKAFIQTGHASVHTLIDAQRGECYHARFKQSADGTAQELEPLSIKDPEQLLPKFQGKACVVGDHVRRWLPEGIHGGVEAYDVFPDATSLLVEASALLDQPGSGKLEPIYLRPTSFVKAPPSRIPLSEEELNKL